MPSLPRLGLQPGKRDTCLPGVAARAGDLGAARRSRWQSAPPVFGQGEVEALARSYDPAKMRIMQSGFEKKDLLVA
ncbi:MAG: hypothetical protein JSS54_13420 [Proteobacteria bacterium]|nr:hypothetical protein [Pseudomonadota bacterium]